MPVNTAPNFRFSVLLAFLFMEAISMSIDRLAPAWLEGLKMTSLQVGLLVCCVGFMWRRGLRSDDLTGPLPDWRTCLRWLGLAVALTVTSGVVIALVVSLGWKPPADLLADVDSVPLEMTVLGVILAPIVEELAFRGLLLRNFQQRMRPWVAVLLSGLLFGLMHLETLVLRNCLRA